MPAVLMALALAVLAPAWLQGAESPTLGAKLVDPEQKARKQTATVEATVGGLRLVDPDTVDGVAKPGEGHLHYQVDKGPVIATTAPKLSFHGLATGPHSIVVTLVGNDHNSLGPKETLAVVIP